MLDTNQLFLRTKGSSGRKGKGGSPQHQLLASTTHFLKCRCIQTKHKGAICGLPVARDGNQETAWKTVKNKPTYPTSWRSHKRGLLVLGSAECESTEAFLPKTHPISDLLAWVRKNSVGVSIRQWWVATWSLLWVLPWMARSPCASCFPRGQAVKVMLICWPMAKREVG